MGVCNVVNIEKNSREAQKILANGILEGKEMGPVWAIPSWCGREGTASENRLTEKGAAVKGIIILAYGGKARR